MTLYLQRQRPSLLYADEYAALSDEERQRHLQANIDLVDEYLARSADGTMTLILADFAPLVASHVESRALMAGTVPDAQIVATYSGAYLLTEWFILTLYIGELRRRFVVEETAQERLALWLLVCFRCMRDVLAYRDTSAIFEAAVAAVLLTPHTNVVNAGAQIRLATDRDGVVNTVSKIRLASDAPRGPERLVLDYDVTLLVRQSGVRRPTPTVALHFSSPLRFYKTMDYFANLYVTSLFYYPANADNVVKAFAEAAVSSLASDLLPHWVTDVLYEPLGADETPFPEGSSSVKYQSQPIWWTRPTARLADPNVDLAHAEPPAAPPSLVGEQAFVPPSSDVAESTRGGGGHSGAPPPAPLLTFLALGLLGATTSVLANYYARKYWSGPPPEAPAPLDHG